MMGRVVKKDTKYRKLILVINMIITFSVILGAILLWMIGSDDPFLPWISLILLLVPVIMIPAFLHDLYRIPREYIIENDKFMLKYGFPSRRTLTIAVNEIKVIRYARMKGGIYSGYIITIDHRKGFEVIVMATRPVIDMMISSLDPKILYPMELKKIQSYIKIRIEDLKIKGEYRDDLKPLRIALVLGMLFLWVLVMVFFLLMISGQLIDSLINGNNILNGIALIAGIVVGIILSIITTILYMRHIKKKKHTEND